MPKVQIRQVTILVINTKKTRPFLRQTVKLSSTTTIGTTKKCPRPELVFLREGVKVSNNNLVIKSMTMGVGGRGGGSKIA